MPCAAPIVPLLEPFRCLFTAPTWKKMLTLLRGTLLARGRRTVTTALCHTGHEQDPHVSTFHQVLNRARWSPLQASRYLLRRISETFVQAGGSLDLVIDETLERRWGIGRPDPQTGPFSRQRALPTRALGEQPGLTLSSCWQWS